MISFINTTAGKSKGITVDKIPALYGLFIKKKEFLSVHY